MSDGPVTAEVTIEGRSIPVEAAWVLTAPPNYGPDVHGVRTLYDLLFDLYIQAGWLPFPAEVSFRDDVYPILQRLSNLQWVNQGFATQFGYGGPNDFEDPDYVAKLARVPRPGEVDIYDELRRQVFNSFRNPEGTDNNQLPWPWIYGDAMDVPPANTPRQNASDLAHAVPRPHGVGRRQVRPLPGPAGGPAGQLSKVPLADQPAMLDRAAARVLPGRRVPPGLRGDLADPAPDDVPCAVPHPPPPARRAGAGLRQDAHAGGRPVADRAAPRARAGRPDAVDGAALAGGHRVLPVRVRHGRTTRTCRPSGRPGCPTRSSPSRTIEIVVDPSRAARPAAARRSPPGWSGPPR